MSTQSISQEQAKESSKKPVVLLISDPRYFTINLNYEIISTISAMGGIYWLYKSGKKFDEIWLDTESSFDHNKAPRPHTDADGRFFCDIMERFQPEFTPKVIRVITRNPVHMKFIQASLGKKYNLSYNIPPNTARGWAEVFQKPIESVKK